MLASCLDASPSPQTLLSQIEHDLKHGIPEIAREFSIKVKKVWRGGMGSIAALKVDVESVWDHKAAPVPTDDKKDIVVKKDEGSRDHDHQHGHGHGHGHEHNSTDHKVKEVSKVESHAHAHSHSHAHGHSHNHSNSEGPLRNLPQIKKMLLNSSREYIPRKVVDLAIETFTELAIAESFTHGTSSKDTVHFHE